MATTIKSGEWTYERMVKELPAESLFELRNFELIEMASPKPKHQEILSNFYDFIKLFVKTNKLGKVFFAPIDVVFAKGDTCIPDVVFISNENLNIIKDAAVFGAPDLLVEVVSKGSVVRDYIEKKNDYEKFGVKEYWIIDPRNETIWVYCLNEGKYELYMALEEDGIAKSKVLEGFEIGFNTVFAEN